ncbi:DNA ligase D, 3'-phosphoesterase domain-containing protein [Cryptococcus neoformans]|nr:DNA ligase D, 3'-phosphoesterase domain-containing protein [Cryptococcus neoformans var. grubii Th84]OXH15727.1 DNA ligase D, 3'-phosphoesterase domain-containing protein [Cryptococcus neoformans var. grubii]OXH36130.1 DNA ligase D, 3'-phosphoesterase domain-containing protein [Cryptococcus neoformans var. grubii]OXH56951.1 DNA ligase D, 3'-phosphoesterase domain-containing protein [Cryptococcus neoformans var. grubii]OXH57098.1 DNA ligase D, 3'-phosphoesterase domain-containing protein [Cry
MWTLHQLTENKAVRSTSAPPSPSSSPSVSRKRARLLSSSPTIAPNLAAEEEVGEVSSGEPGSSKLEEDGNGPKPDVEREWKWFSTDVLEKWPALKKRNFWCIQRHSATALHYDLRMHLDGVTVSWAVPKGLLGISKSGEARRMAVETTLHPLWYTIHEGSDGRTFGQSRQGGTLLWDIGEYTIDLPSGYIPDLDTDEEEEAENRRRFKKKRGDSENDGREEEDKFRKALHRHIGFGKSRSIHFTLKGGKKMTNHSFILVLSSNPNKSSTVSLEGKEKKTWFISLPRGVDSYPWDQGGEDGDYYGRSIKSECSFHLPSSSFPSLRSFCVSSHIAPP